MQDLRKYLKENVGKSIRPEEKKSVAKKKSTKKSPAKKKPTKK